MSRIRVLLRGRAQQRPPDSHCVLIKRVVERRWIGQCLRKQAQQLSDPRHETEAVDHFGISPVLLQPQAVNDDVYQAGNLPLAGFPAYDPNACLASRRQFRVKSKRLIAISPFARLHPVINHSLQLGAVIYFQ